MRSTTSTTSMPHSERHPGHLTVVVRNVRPRSRSARLLAIVNDPSCPAEARRIAVVTTPCAPFLRCLAVLGGGLRPEPPDGGPAAPLVAARRVA